MSDGFADYLTEVLQLDREHLERVARRTEQWARAIELELEREEEEEEEEEEERTEAKDRPAEDHEEDRQREAEMRRATMRRREAATLFAIAGSYSLVLGPAAARGALRHAVGHLELLESTFAYPLAVCDGSDEIPLRAQGRPIAGLAAGGRADVLLAIGWLDTAAARHGREGSWEEQDQVVRHSLHQHLESSRPSAETPVGRLGVPFGAVARVISAADQLAHVDRSDGPELDQLRAALHDYLLRANDVTQAAMGDRYHWTRMMSSVLPLEPEAVALAAIAMAASIPHDADDAVIESLDLPATALAPLHVGREIARSGGWD